MSEHKRAIRRNDHNHPAAVHFNDTKHDMSSLCFYGIEKVMLQHGSVKWCEVEFHTSLQLLCDAVNFSFESDQPGHNPNLLSLATHDD